MSGKIEVTIHTARPGLVIGKKGSDIDKITYIDTGFTRTKLLFNPIARAFEERLKF